MTMREQVAVMLGCTVFVSPCGGVSMDALFLPRGAAAVLVINLLGLALVRWVATAASAVREPT